MTSTPSSAKPRRVHLGHLDIDDVTLPEALDAITALVARGQGGTVLTPNVDHVVRVEDDADLCEAYAAASLSLVDGVPILWASHLLGEPLRAKVSGSDLVLPLMQRAAQRGLRVYFLGGEEGVAERAAEHLVRVVPDLLIVGVDAPRIDHPSAPDPWTIERARAVRPDLVLVALGCPKQEIFMHAAARELAPAVLLGVGASLDFWAGTASRAPAWISAAGFEWLYRLVHEPRRLWRRYLQRDPRFLLILARELRSRSKSRAPRNEVKS
jgi:N-acetylglucosaminyldiphosphoundecaprenol N-acetyl-beta-D-mannosaminyltransferase